ncbi:MAG: hypothetical protein JSV98_01080 [candidate division WOR-3 bacterium]|nr:MAG: hypothetical protein JSV98_01080 [candidate division WOR-3 bacterium]
MISLILILATSVVWQEDFAETSSVIQQLYDYHVEIIYQDGRVRLTANPPFEGFASAWLYIDGDTVFSDSDALVIRIKGNENPVRVRYFFRKAACKEYYAGESIITASKELHDVKIPLKHAALLSGTEFPAALTPGLDPIFFLFIENAAPGEFEIEIDQISVVRHPPKAEER